jgi:hypothetical protein
VSFIDLVVVGQGSAAFAEASGAVKQRARPFYTGVEKMSSCVE